MSTDAIIKTAIKSAIRSREAGLGVDANARRMVKELIITRCGENSIMNAIFLFCQELDLEVEEEIIIRDYYHDIILDAMPGDKMTERVSGKPEITPPLFPGLGDNVAQEGRDD